MMNMSDFVRHLDGMNAGILLAGISFGWGLCVKIRVGPLREHKDRLEDKLDDLNTRIQVRYFDGR